MIQLYKILDQIDRELSVLLEQGSLTDYRIYLKANNNIAVYLIAEDEIKKLIHDKYPSDYIEIELFKEGDDTLKDIYFSSPTKVNLSTSDRRLVNLLDEEREDNTSINTPIVTFYSYKGGVGRSTTLASCASYLSMHYKKKIVVIDCDFEAPGFTNFFLTDPGTPFYSNGVIEYLLDSEFLENEVDVRNYIWEASKQYSGEGQIFVMPSGNLSGESEDLPNDRDHYLKGLARIDFSEKPFIVQRFTQLIKKIEEEIKPDLVILDSRTGFNDIFGLTAFQLSNIVVGFFGNNVQTLPGIQFFIDSLVKRDYIVGIIVNSIIPAANRRRWFSNFKENVERYLSIKSIENQSESSVNSDQLSIPMFPITRHEILENLGTSSDDILDFIDFVCNKSFTDHVDLFEKINSLLEDFSPISEEGTIGSDVKVAYNIGDTSEENPSAEITVNSEAEEIIIEDAKAATNDSESDVYLTKMRVLTTLKDRMPELYAEDIEDFEQEYAAGRYFYRNCMSDLFNLDKFIVLGNKGTGKTYIYRSLNNKNIVSEIKNRANKQNINYEFIHLILKSKYFFDTTKFDGMEIYSPEKYYERFWQVYIWVVLCTELGTDLAFSSSLEIFPISDNTQTSSLFHKMISDDEKMIQIENDLEIIDSLLKQKGDKHVIIIFDELDHVVKPHHWSKRVSPLINLCKKMTFSRIYPKMFLRSDLFEKISNVNNIQALNNRSINIEWTREELFAYFFKLILSHSKDDFFNLMREYRDYPPQHISKIRRQIEGYNMQPDTDEYFLKHLTATFFGKYADVSNTPRFGESYDWFFKNLKNANETISLRPFIDLLSEAVKWAINEDKSLKPILHPYYYTHGKARGQAVEKHFNDLAKEEGNNDLQHVFKYIQDYADDRYKLLELQQNDFYKLLSLIIDKYHDVLDYKTEEGLIELLKVNGIIVERFIRTGTWNNGQKRYRFALLYKYYLGLKNRAR